MDAIWETYASDPRNDTRCFNRSALHTLAAERFLASKRDQEGGFYLLAKEKPLVGARPSKALPTRKFAFACPAANKITPAAESKSAAWLLSRTWEAVTCACVRLWSRAQVKTRKRSEPRESPSHASSFPFPQPGKPWSLPATVRRDIWNLRGTATLDIRSCGAQAAFSGWRLFSLPTFAALLALGMLHRHLIESLFSAKTSALPCWLFLSSASPTSVNRSRSLRWSSQLLLCFLAARCDRTRPKKLQLLSGSFLLSTETLSGLQSLSEGGISSFFSTFWKISCQLKAIFNRRQYSFASHADIPGSVWFEPPTFRLQSVFEGFEYI